MKRLFIYLLVVIGMFSISQNCYALLGPGINLTLQTSQKSNNNDPTLNETGRRDATQPVYCYISENGIETDVPLFGIISYEVWDAQGTAPIAVFTGEYDFIDYLFSLSGTYMVVLETDDLILSGQVFIE